MQVLTVTLTMLLSAAAQGHPASARPDVAVRFQDALELLAQGEQGRKEWEVGVLPADQLETVQQTLRDAATSLESLDKEIQSELLRRRRAAPPAGELSADDLARLSEQVQFRIVRATKNRGLLYATGSDDRLSLLLAARTSLERLAPQVPKGDALHTEIQLDLAECQRLLGRFAEAAELATELDRDGTPIDARQRARAELLRAGVGQNDREQIVQLIGASAISAQPAPELSFARFEAFLMLARDTADTKRYQDQAAEALQSLEAGRDAYLARRASQLLITALPRTTLVNVGLLSRVADSLYLQGDAEQAIAAYGEAAGLARQQRDNDRAFEFTGKAALIEQKLQRHAAAATRLRDLANSMPTHSQTTEAHLLAAWNAFQAAKHNSSAAASYGALLREHLKTWPNAKTADQVRMWLGAHCESKRAWADAIDAYSGVSFDSSHHAAAASGLIRAWRKELATPEDRPVQALPEVATAWIETIDKLIASDATLSPVQRHYLSQARAHSLALAGRRDEALSAYQQLAEAHPTSGRIQTSYARLLLLGTDKAERTKALAQWRLVASKSPPHADRWLEAQYSIALAEFKLGNHAAAATLLKATLETPPGLSETPWLAKYEELLRKCEP